MTSFRASTILGSRIVKVEPWPGSLSTVMSPPIIWQNRRLGQDVDFQVNGDQAQAIYVIDRIGAKSKIAAGVLALLLGGLGIHKFYIGANGAGVIMLLVSIVGLVFAGIPSAIVAIVALIEGIIYLTRTDEDFYQTYEIGKKAWF